MTTTVEVDSLIANEFELHIGDEIATGIFANPAVNSAGTGLFYGNPKQVWIQVLSILGTAVYSAVATLIVIAVTRLLTGRLRIDKDSEIEGLDSAFHGERGFEIQG